MSRPVARPLLLPLAAALASVLALSACENPQKKKEEELAKNTFACQLNGERFVVRFAEGEARVLLPGMQRVTLYQIPSMGAGPRPLQQRQHGAARQGRGAPVHHGQHDDAAARLRAVRRAAASEVMPSPRAASSPRP